MKPKTIALVLFLFTGLNVFLALNRHSHSKPHSYHGELWADRGGYFVYLPAAIQFGFDARKFPSGMDTLAGRGFKLDTLQGRVITKYTSGVAMLQAPFYLLGHGIALMVGIPAYPYGPLDHVIVDVAAPVLASLALLFLFLVLRRRYGDRLSAWMLLALFAGSNLFFYTIGDPGMSHVYSFFLFAFLMFSVDQWFRVQEGSYGLVLIGVTAGLIVLVRPTNALFLLAVPFVVLSDQSSVWQTIKANVTLPRIFLVTVPALMVWVPQLFYWQYAYGSALTWPYIDEGFTNWASPELVRFWFAPNNGLFPYSPLFAIVIWAAWIMWRRGERAVGAAALITFMAVSYLGASWWVWHFGCGFGSRTMVEYLALFAIPLAGWTQWAAKRWGRWMPITVFLVLAAYNLKLVYSYGNCWFFDEWDWQAFGQLVVGPTK
ncbi:MAG: hypothetical protein KF905_07760 [Flavobacteriales bacterium]|nr:hypothetical protein [Flavobacteriales bacterium]